MNEPLVTKTPNTVVVVIHSDGSVDPDAIELDMKKHDCIIWVSEADVDCDVVFDTQRGSPFGKDFKVSAHGWEMSGPITAHVPPNGRETFHFESMRMGQTVAADPDVIIKN
jgi:hypothetical protein